MTGVHIFRVLLGREPTAQERALITSILGASTDTKQSLGDLIWAVTMLPEFQLIQ